MRICGWRRLARGWIGNWKKVKRSEDVFEKPAGWSIQFACVEPGVRCAGHSMVSRCQVRDFCALGTLFRARQRMERPIVLRFGRMDHEPRQNSGCGIRANREPV